METVLDCLCCSHHEEGSDVCWFRDSVDSKRLTSCYLQTHDAGCCSVRLLRIYLHSKFPPVRGDRGMYDAVTRNDVATKGEEKTVAEEGPTEFLLCQDWHSIPGRWLDP